MVRRGSHGADLSQAGHLYVIANSPSQLAFACVAFAAFAADKTVPSLNL